MELGSKMAEILKEQKNLVKKYEDVVSEYQSNDLVNQNLKLKTDLERMKKVLGDLELKFKVTKSEEEKLKIALKEQILDEKFNILKISEEKMSMYFKASSTEYKSSLQQLQYETKSRLEKLKQISMKELKEEAVSINVEIDNFCENLNKEIEAKKSSFENKTKGTFEDFKNESEKLRDVGIDEETVQKRIRQNNIEVKIGLNWINKIGILLILIGVATALKYTYSNFFNPHIKGISAFALGAIFLCIGEWLNKKDKNVFAQGITGGGIGILYYSIFSSHFLLKIIDLNTGMLLSVMATIVALVLSLRYNSITICGFALVGGFLPFFTYVFTSRLNPADVYIAMGYLFILNLLTLIISYYKKWDIINYLSFLLNVPTLIFLISKSPNEIISISYAMLTFVMYLLIVLIYPLRLKSSLKILDIILLGLNTTINCLIIYNLFDKVGLKDYKGILALVFCIIYLGIGQLSSKLLTAERGTQAIFYLTSFTFAILMVPFQFGIKWMALGWLVEGVLLTFYGHKIKEKKFEISGWVIFVLCLISFYFIDCVGINSWFNGKVPFFKLRYAGTMLGMIIMTYIYLPDFCRDNVGKYNGLGTAFRIFKYFTTVNFWIFLLYNSYYLYGKYVSSSVKLPYTVQDYYKALIFAFITILTAFIIKRAPMVADRQINAFSIALYSLADLVCIITNLQMHLYRIESTAYYYLSLILVILFNIYTFMNLRYLLIKLLEKRRIGFEIFPIALAAYLLSTLTSILIVQFNLGKLNLLFSLLYLSASLGFIIYGFKRRFVMIRRVGLGLCILSVGKLFVYDLALINNTQWKIASYFAFGIVLIGISYIYQRFEKSLNTNVDKIKE